MSEEFSHELLNFLREAIHGKRVLDIGDENSPFLADVHVGIMKLAFLAHSWMVVGRNPPRFIPDLPPTFKISDEAFDPQFSHLGPANFDIILFSSPSPSKKHDAVCLKWAQPNHQVIILHDKRHSEGCGSPEFWELAKEWTVEKDFQDDSGSLHILKKTPPVIEEKKEEEEEEEEHHHNLPKRDERYRLAPSTHWPGKQRGDRPPVVKILSDWKKKNGQVQLISDGTLLSIRHGELGSRM